MSFFCDHKNNLVQFFLMEGDLIYCNDINNLMAALTMTYDPDEWRLFIDSSETSLKAVLLHNWNFLPSISVGHAVHMKDIWQHVAAAEVHIIWATPMSPLWWFEICCSHSMLPAWINKVLLFYLKMGQQSQRIPLCHKSLVTTKVIGNRKEKGPTSNLLLTPRKFCSHSYTLSWG